MTFLSFILANNSVPVVVAPGYPGPQAQYGYPQYAPGVAPYPGPQAFPGKYFIGIFPVKLSPFIRVACTLHGFHTLRHFEAFHWDHVQSIAQHFQC